MKSRKVSYIYFFFLKNSFEYIIKKLLGRLILTKNFNFSRYIIIFIIILFQTKKKSFPAPKVLLNLIVSHKLEYYLKSDSREIYK